MTQKKKVKGKVDIERVGDADRSINEKSQPDWRSKRRQRQIRRGKEEQEDITNRVTENKMNEENGKTTRLSGRAGINMS